MIRSIRSSRETRQRPSLRRGQALIEFALVLPVLALFLLSILQFGVLFSTQVGITNAVREAVRNASALPVATVSDATNAANSVYSRLTGTNGLLARTGSSYLPGALVQTGSPRTQVCYYSYLDETNNWSIMARVNVQYRHPLFIPVVSSIIDGFDGANDQAYRIGVSEEVRVSNGILANTDIGNNGNPTCIG
jgi:Flp pilus assembly protein TadG